MFILGLTCDFGQKMANKNKSEDNGDESIASPFGRAGGRFAVGLDTGQKPRFTWKQRQEQRVRGWWRVYIPPIAKCAMDGAPVLFWLGEG
jgi:hypothetical protein